MWGEASEERGRGKAVGVMALPGAEYCAAMLAVWRLGWIAVPLSPSHPIGELTHAIREARVEIVFVTDNLLDKVADLGSLCPVRAVRYIDDVPRDLDDASRDDLDEQSRTDTKRRRPRHLHQRHDRRAESRAAHARRLLARTDRSGRWRRGVGPAKIRSFYALPLNHVHGIVNAWMCAHAVGAEVTFCAKFSATEWWRSADDYEQTTDKLRRRLPSWACPPCTYV